MRSTITILLVDDHAIVRQGCRLLLEQAGFEIAGETSSGEDAYASCLQHSPRVVIMDLAMPGMGGLEAIRGIRAFSWASVCHRDVVPRRDNLHQSNDGCTRTAMSSGSRQDSLYPSRAKLCEMDVRLADLAD